jgi:hypothetical protein
VKHLSHQEKAFRTNPERLRHMVQSRIEKWAIQEDIDIDISVYTHIDNPTTLFPNLLFKNEDCITFVRLLNTKATIPSFSVILHCRKGFILSGKLADMLTKEASISISKLFDEKDWFDSDIN